MSNELRLTPTPTPDASIRAPIVRGADAAAIHQAVNATPLPHELKLPSTGASVAITPSKWGKGIVYHGGVAFVGAHPEKDSKYGRKLRAGGAVTLVNPNRTKGFEARHLTIESLEPCGPCTVSERAGAPIEGVLEVEQLRADVASGEPGHLNEFDPSRMRDDAELQKREAETDPAGAALKKIKRKKGSEQEFVKFVEAAKTGRAKCKVCKETIEKGALRFGYEVKYQGRPSNAYMHLNCAPKPPPPTALPDLEGFAELSPQGKEDARAASLRPPLIFVD